ncbi:FOXN2 protein, partial [Polyodon spathula]|nr:FOXN2 protein [Polyodon spathula]
MGPVIGMSPDKKAETPGIQELVGSPAATCGMGTLPEAESAASPKATSVDKGLGDDEELTNLNWLHENLLQNFTLGTETQPSVSPLYDIEGGGAVPACSSSCSEGQEKDSLKSKPPYSFSLLIYMAIEQSRNKCLPVKEIYSWILDHFPYFANAPTGWKNSVRHNLSLNKCFRKVERNLGKANGKGSLWCVDPEYRPNLIQALKKQHFPAAHAFCTPPASPLSGSSPPQHLILQDQGCSLKESDIDAATAMMLLNSSPEQHGMHWVQDNPIDLSRPETAVVNNDPKEDHNYSATLQHCVSRSSVSRSSVSSLSSVDEAFEYAPQARRAGTKGPAGKKPRKEVKQEIDEELKEAAGSLLHLAGIRTCLDASRRTAKSKRQSKK